MKLERLITVFDNVTERLIDEINIDYLSLGQLKIIFNPPDDDPLMYNVYEITLDNVKRIKVLLRQQIAFDFDVNSYFVECVQLPPYDFGKK